MTTRTNLVGIMLLVEETEKRKKGCSVVSNCDSVSPVNV